MPQHIGDMFICIYSNYCTFLKTFYINTLIESIIFWIIQLRKFILIIQYNLITSLLFNEYYMSIEIEIIIEHFMANVHI
jgi:hypothetical protein